MNTARLIGMTTEQIDESVPRVTHDQTSTDECR